MDEKKIIVLWFRNDLRLSDNLALVQATAEADEIIPFYCFDDRSFRHQIAGFPKTGAIRAEFLLESIADLQLACAEKNLHLQVSCGDTVKALQDLYRKYSFDSIFCGRQTCSEELHVEEQIEAAGFRLQRFWQAGLYDPDALPFKIDQLPDVYTAFRKKVEKYGVIDPVLAVPSNLMGPSDLGPCTIPTLKDLGHNKVEPDPRAAMTFIGGSA
jgi:deoxyribodipyrimidine photo-lyase